jgi:hypothetical protein
LRRPASVDDADADEGVRAPSIAARHLRDTNDLLRNQLDRLVNLFRRSNPDFVAAYRGARVIVDRAATHEVAKPKVGPTPAVV